ncbi:MAG: hypothetical protein ACRDJH_13315 [Thermomicrobiales bacterium]
MTHRRAALPRAARVLIAISSLALFGGTLLGAGSAKEVAARGGCDEAAARAIYWAEGYEAQVMTGDGFVWTSGLGAPGSVVIPTSVPVLMYHRINDYPAQYEITVDALYQQMNWLAANGYNSVTPADLIAAIDYGVPLPPNPFMLTVDDGFVSTFTFAAVFAEYGFRGT